MTTTAVYVISIAAELTGVHPQTLRAWERAAVVVPRRSTGGARRYSDEDIALARKVRALLDQGVSLCGVRHILTLEAQLAAAHHELERLRARLAATGPGV